MSDVLVLCYHAVSEGWDSELAVTPERLEEQLSLLVRRGYRGATLAEAALGPPAARTVAVTFDDGYRSVLELALPVLARLGLPGSIFVPTDFVGSGAPMSWEGIDHWASGPDRSELICLSWDELKQLADAGWEVGSHTCSHPHLTRLDDRALRQELTSSREQCELHLERPCESIAYPFGDNDGRVAAAAADCGYRVGATLPRFCHAPHPLRWPRVGIYPNNSPWEYRLKVSPLLRRVTTRVTRPPQ